MKTDKDLQQQIAEATAKNEAELAARIAKLKRDNELAALCPEGFEAASASYTKYDDVDTLHYDVDSAVGTIALVEAWRAKYGPFLTIGEYHKGCTTVTAFPWKEYAEVEPKHTCEDAVEVRNHAGRGFNAVSLRFYPNVPGQRICVRMSEAFRANIQGLHGHISANYDSTGYPIYNSIHKVAPPAFGTATFTLRYGSGSDDSAEFVGVFSTEQLRKCVKF